MWEKGLGGGAGHARNYLYQFIHVCSRGPVAYILPQFLDISLQAPQSNLLDLVPNKLTEAIPSRLTLVAMATVHLLLHLFMRGTYATQSVQSRETAGDLKP